MTKDKKFSFGVDFEEERRRLLEEKKRREKERLKAERQQKIDEQKIKLMPDELEAKEKAAYEKGYQQGLEEAKSSEETVTRQLAETIVIKLNCFDQGDQER